jgi:hypothetical protein
LYSRLLVLRRGGRKDVRGCETVAGRLGPMVLDVKNDGSDVLNFVVQLR